MFLGIYKNTNQFEFQIAVHRFETGELIACTGEAWLYDPAGYPEDGTELTFEAVTGFTGIYRIKHTTDPVSVGLWSIYVKLTVDTVNIAQVFTARFVPSNSAVWGE